MDENMLAKYEEKVKGLMELGKSKKNKTLEYSEVVDFMEELKLSPDQIERLVNTLEKTGIDVLRISDADDDLPPMDEELLLGGEEDVDIEINLDDLRIDTYRSSGAGGQHINKTSSAIRITHLPTGIVVQCQNECSQHQNKDKAMQMLKAKLYMLKQESNAEKLSDIRGEVKEIGWGNQIRSYVLQPYTMVKDHRTSEESGNVDAVLDGAIDPFINAYLRSLSTSNQDSEEN